MPGILTVHLAEILTQELDRYALDVLYDHGQASDMVGRIVSWFGKVYNAKSRLSFLDIAVISRDTHKAIALIEIEETTAKPKVLIGDVLAILLGDGIKFRGKRDLCIGTWTTLIVLANSSSSPYVEQVHFLETQVKLLKDCLTTRNASIGEVVIGLFDDGADLEVKAKEQIEHARSRFS